MAEWVWVPSDNLPEDPANSTGSAPLKKCTWWATLENREHSQEKEREASFGEALNAKLKHLDEDYTPNSPPCQETQGSGFVSFSLTLLTKTDGPSVNDLTSLQHDICSPTCDYRLSFFRFSVITINSSIYQGPVSIILLDIICPIIQMRKLRPQEIQT